MIIEDPATRCNIMLDLETLGVKSDAPIVAIGACVIGSDGADAGFYAAVKPQGVAEFSTIAWWLRQSVLNPDASSKIAEAIENGFDAATALDKFTVWVDSVARGRDIFIWGNGASFDEPLLGNLYRQNDRSPPWNFRASRCYRTAVGMFGHLADKPEAVGVAHDALSDAQWQAAYLCAIDGALGKLFLR